MTDTNQRRSRLEATKGFVADLARPFSIIATSAAGAWAIVDVGSRVNEGQAAIYVAAVLAGLGGLYFGKSWEVGKVSKHNAEVEVAKAQATPPPGTAQITAAPDVDVTVREVAPDPTMYGGPRP